MALSFARDIRPMFRDSDVDTMQDYGLDLSSYADVKNKVQAIYPTLAEGTMPCDGAWPRLRSRDGPDARAQVNSFDRLGDESKYFSPAIS